MFNITLTDKRGFTLVEVLIAVVILGFLIAIAMPNFNKAKLNVYRDTCINNLRMINLAKEQWALENDKDVGDEPTAADLDGYIKDGTDSLVCPLDSSGSFDTSYSINAVGTNPLCKISASDHKL